MSRRAFRPAGIVSIADALIALDGLSGAELEQAWQWLPELLGIQRSPPSEADRVEGSAFAPGSGDRLQGLRERRRVRHREHGEREDELGVADREPAAGRHAAPTIPALLVVRQPRDPAWLDQEDDDLGAAKPFRFSDLPPLEPLLDPQRSRSVISSALATSQSDGDLDVDEILVCVTRRQPLLDLPRLKVPTTRLGLQLLLDRGEAMTPYLRDQEMLAAAIRNVVGEDRVEALRFAQSPLDGVGSGSGVNLTYVYHSPAPGTPVVLLTDLGIGGAREPATGASVDEWRRFARRQQSAGCPVLAIVPYDLGRVPAALRACFRLLPWSRTTTVATVRHLIGRGLEAVG